MSLNVEVTFTLNGITVRANPPVQASALELLRSEFDLAGTKLACGEGECGACTIEVDNRTRNACLMPAVDLDGRDVKTVEGLITDDGLDPVQRAFVEAGAVQCGFCTPGMVMQAKNLIERNPNLTRAEIARGIEGNICRCTGYTKIIDAVATAAQRKAGG